MPITHLLLLLLAAVAGSLLGPVLAEISRRRSIVQPLPAHQRNELDVVAAVLASPGLYVYVHQLRAEHFTDPHLARCWDLVERAAAHVPVPETRGSIAEAFKSLESLEPTVAEAVGPDLAGSVDPETRERLLSRAATLGDLSGRAIVELATPIYSSGVDRTEFAGRSTIRLTGDDEQPLVRDVPPVGWRRRSFAAALTVFGLIAALVGARRIDGGTLEVVLVGAALATLALGSVIWTLVDLDTMYIDTLTFTVFTVLAWFGALAAGIAGGRAGDVITGLVVSASIVAFIEIVNQVYRRVRQQHGMGMGDYLLILATIGVPVAVTGSWQLGQTTLIASLLAGIIGWVLHRVIVPGFTRNSPYAFGPYLATGWMITVLGWGLS